MNYMLKVAPLAIAAAVALAACGKKEEPVKAEPAKAPAPVAAPPVAIKIGHVAPLTGGIAPFVLESHADAVVGERP